MEWYDELVGFGMGAGGSVEVKLKGLLNGFIFSGRGVSLEGELGTVSSFGFCSGSEEMVIGSFGEELSFSQILLIETALSAGVSKRFSFLKANVIVGISYQVNKRKFTFSLGRVKLALFLSAFSFSSYSFKTLNPYPLFSFFICFSLLIKLS